MAGIEMEDRTGKPLDVREYQECIEAITRMMGPAMMKLPPELAVMVPQIRRCLVQGQKLTELFERSIQERTGATGSVGVEQGYGTCGSCRGTTPMPGPCRYCGHTN